MLARSRDPSRDRRGEVTLTKEMKNIHTLCVRIDSVICDDGYDTLGCDRDQIFSYRIVYKIPNIDRDNFSLNREVVANSRTTTDSEIVFKHKKVYSIDLSHELIDKWKVSTMVVALQTVNSRSGGIDKVVRAHSRTSVSMVDLLTPPFYICRDFVFVGENFRASASITLELGTRNITLQGKLQEMRQSALNSTFSVIDRIPMRTRARSRSQSRCHSCSDAGGSPPAPRQRRAPSPHPAVLPPPPQPQPPIIQRPSRNAFPSNRYLDEHMELGQHRSRELNRLGSSHKETGILTGRPSSHSSYSSFDRHRPDAEYREIGNPSFVLPSYHSTPVREPENRAEYRLPLQERQLYHGKTRYDSDGSDSVFQNDSRSISRSSKSSDYVRGAQRVQFTLHAANNLPRVRNLFGEPMPPQAFVQMLGRGERVQSPVAPANVNPRWDWTGTFVFSSERGNLIIKMLHMGEDNKIEPLGMCVLNAPLVSCETKTYELVPLSTTTPLPHSASITISIEISPIRPSSGRTTVAERITSASSNRSDEESVVRWSGSRSSPKIHLMRRTSTVSSSPQLRPRHPTEDKSHLLKENMDKLESAIRPLRH